jgi:hypothetical protein
MSILRRDRLPAFFFGFCTFMLAISFDRGPLFADHGPGTTGGSTTQSGETMKPGTFSLGFQWDYTQFESLSAADIERRTRKVDADDDIHFDALRWNSLWTVSLAYGVAEDFQLGVSTGWYRGDDQREGTIDDLGNYEFHDQGDVVGMTDLWVTGKYRVLRGPFGHWALYGGVKFPTGRDDVRADGETEPLEPSVQPGSGAFDFLGGTAYSVWLTERITLDASAQYTYRTENDDFKIGDRIDAGAVVSFRLTEDVQQYPQVAVFGEISVRHGFKNEEDGHKTVNSGGTVLFLSPGVRASFTQHVSLSVAPQFPVVEDLNDEQQETLFKILTALTFTF